MGDADDPACDGRRRDIARRLLMCNPDELDVLDEVLMRLEKGRDEYGPLNLNDQRDWQHEEAEELLDAQMYRVFAKLRAKRARLEEIAR